MGLFRTRKSRATRRAEARAIKARAKLEAKLSAKNEARRFRATHRADAKALKAQLKAQREEPKSEMDKMAIDFLHNDTQARVIFIDKIAAPVANKMFECGMFP